ncbi:MAG TPA: hypothetical protein VE972_12135 [Conexibacter sp.]|nr:hypothetical protein [Conexibacter sp.]
MDEEFEATVDGREPRFPNRTTIVAADVVTDDMIRHCHTEGRAVVIVDEHGDVQFLPVP